jgi:hypothetical protein
MHIESLIIAATSLIVVVIVVVWLLLKRDIEDYSFFVLDTIEEDFNKSIQIGQDLSNLINNPRKNATAAEILDQIILYLDTQKLYYEADKPGEG